MRLIDADALTDFLKCLLPGRGMWEIDGDVGKNAVCETVAEAIEMVKNMETIKPETNCSEIPNSSDCISRRAAINLVRDVCDAIMSGCESWYDPETGDEVYKDIREVDAILKCNKEVRIVLRNMPSAQPQKGKWIDIKYTFMTKCSVCGWINNDDSSYNFCPSCGTDMREGDSDEKD